MAFKLKSLKKEAGTKYILKEADQSVTVDKYILDNEIQVYAIVNGQLIRQGKVPNIEFLPTFQLIVGSDGQVKLERVNENTHCYVQINT